MTEPTTAAGHEPHPGKHTDYACGLSGPHCWMCSEPWPCRASRGITEADARRNDAPAIEAEARQQPSTPPALDVDRLKQSLINTVYCLWDNDAGYVIEDADLAEVAAEYARLQEQDFGPNRIAVARHELRLRESSR